MRIKRSSHDMFGRPPAPAPAPAAEQRATRPQRSIPPGLRPFVPVIALVIVLAAILVLPAVGIGLVVLVFVVLFAAIIRGRYRAVKDVDYYTLRRRDPLYRSLDDFRHGRNRLDDPDR